MTEREWTLPDRYRSSGGDVAYGIFGEGEPVVLVHGTPSSSYLWRRVVRRLSSRYRVHVYDLVGYGESDKRDGQDVSLEAQGKVLSELLGHWQLDAAPGMVGHDIGGAIILRAHLLHGARYRAMVLLDAVTLAPWITPFSRHVQEHMPAFSTMPEYIHRSVVAAHLRSAIHSEVSDADLEPYLRAWTGPGGQAAYYRHVGQLDERYTDEIQARYGSIEVPTLILWGAEDAWLDVSIAARLHEMVPGSRLQTIAGAGHFSPEDAPTEVATAVGDFMRTHLDDR